jgi:UbiD family decarboxylase
VTYNKATQSYNLSIQRLQLAGKNKLRVSFHSRGDAWRIVTVAESRGEKTPIAFVVGGHPAILLAAASKAPWGFSEYELAGGLMGEPVELVKLDKTGLLVPAHSEFVIEGFVVPNLREDEGPFSEYTGYSSKRSTRHVVEVVAVYTRKNPMHLDVAPGNSVEHLLLGRAYKEAEVYKLAREKHPNLKQLSWSYPGVNFVCYASLSKPIADGQPKQLGLLLLGLDPYLKIVVVTDDDINVEKEDEVVWAIATRVQPARDIIILEGAFCNKLDPSSDKPGVCSKMVIDATIKPWMLAERVRLPRAAVEKALKLLQATGNKI